jgi:hypothetical protein
MDMLLEIYNRAVKAVPTVKWAMGCAGLLAVGAIGLMVTNNDIKKAVSLFACVAIAMLVLMVIAGRFPGPRVVLVWSTTIAAVACLFMTITAYAIGCPNQWAELVGARPTCTVVSSDGIISTAHAQSDREEYVLRESSGDCAIDKTFVKKVCHSSGRAIAPQLTIVNEYSGNCRSSLLKPRYPPSEPHCVEVPYRLKGCGYDTFLGLKNCKGRAWVHGNVSIQPAQSQ